MAKAKIIATIGPSSSSKETIREMMLAGVDAFRFNFSHGDHNSHRENFNNIRDIAKSLKRPITLVQDLAGPKIRINDVVKPFNIRKSDEIDLVSSCQVGDATKLGLNYPDILDRLDKGCRVFLADGQIALKVVDRIKDGVRLKALNDGVVSSRKGLNFPDIHMDLPALTKKDLKDLEFGISLGFDYIALSFVKNGKDILLAKNAIKSYNSDIQVIAKIEKHEALKNIDEIIEHADGIMIARGDLGIEIDVEEVPVIQKELIKKANKRCKLVIVATQMLTSMILNPKPTRAEVSDIANALLDGADALMVSDETAVGKYPLEVVKTMVKTISNAEKLYTFCKDYSDTCNISFKTEISIASTSCRLATELKAELICVFTKTGATARFVSMHRPICDIYTLVYDENTYNRLNILWGIKPFMIIPDERDLDKILSIFIKEAFKENILSKDKLAIAIMGFPAGQPGSTNLVKVLRSADYDRYLEIYNSHSAQK
ncbi:MAG: pyruvate kinase [Deferribacterota bacterium]|nr:pyruvate kinase [Deferribacterota bacterium]